MAGIFHTTSIVGANHGSYQISADAWNEEHTIENDTEFPRPVFVDPSTPTKQVTTDISGATASTVTTLTFVQTASRAITFPDATTTLIGTNTTNVLQNKSFGDASDISKVLAFSLSGVTAAKTATLTFINTDNRAYTFPDSSGTLVLSGAIVNADINASAAIAYSKLNLAGSIVNADVNASAAIAYSKLNLGTSIVNADINASAAIAKSKISTSGTWATSDLPATVMYTDGTQTVTVAKTYNDTTLLFRNPADTFSYTVKAGAITAARQLNLPVITGTDTLATLGLAQTFTAKLTLYGIIDTIAALTYSATTDIDFDLTETVTLDLTGNVTFTTSNKGAGKRKTIKILADSSTRTFGFPSWKFLGAAAPASIAANKTAVLILECFSTTDASVLATYLVEP